MVKTKKCDHTSVGMLIKKGDRLLLIERKKFPFGFASPAGHCDGDDFETAAKRELQGEVGLEAKGLSLVFEGRKDNRCRRQDGNWHDWRIYEVKTEGEVNRSLDETKQAGWYSREEVESLARRTEDYLAGKIVEEEWQASPGLEPIWCEFLKELKIV